MGRLCTGGYEIIMQLGPSTGMIADGVPSQTGVNIDIGTKILRLFVAYDYPFEDEVDGFARAIQHEAAHVMLAEVGFSDYFEGLDEDEQVALKPVMERICDRIARALCKQ